MFYVVKMEKMHFLSNEPESLAMCLWIHRKGGDGGFGKIIWGKIIGIFYDFARHDFAAVFIRNRECQVEALSRKSLMIGASNADVTGGRRVFPAGVPPLV